MRSSSISYIIGIIAPSNGYEKFRSKTIHHLDENTKPCDQVRAYSQMSTDANPSQPARSFKWSNIFKLQIIYFGSTRSNGENRQTINNKNGIGAILHPNAIFILFTSANDRLAMRAGEKLQYQTRPVLDKA